MDQSTVDALLTGMVQSESEVSDLIFISGKPPLVESYGQLREFPIDTADGALSSDLIGHVADVVIGANERLRANYKQSGSCDTSYAIEGVARFRVNIYKQNSGRAIVMRKLPSEVPTVERLGLPPVFLEMTKEKNGIVLITGAAGSGKTTTLAALLNYLNQSQPIHLLTLEDPIEFVYPPARAAVSQRELGRDFESFATGLRASLRQAPKVILVGEIRDRETMEIALTAAETGHVVFTTLHTINAGQTINRILGFFSREEEEQLRYRLSDTVRYIVSQRLVPKIDGGRLLINEVIGNSLRTRESIRYGESEGKTFHDIIEAGTSAGWQSFDRCLLDACQSGVVSEEIALLYCTDRGRMRRDLDLMQKTKGGKTDSLSGLKLDMVAPPKLAVISATEQAARLAAQQQAR